MKDPFEENADLLRAFEERPVGEGLPVPVHVLYKLEATRLSLLKPRLLTLPRLLLSAAAVLTLLGMSAWLALPAQTASVVVVTPGDQITDAQPTISWTSKDAPGQLYDVWLLPSEGDVMKVDALAKVKAVRSPVPYDRFQIGKLAAGKYRVLVCLADMGRSAGVPVVFEVVE